MRARGRDKACGVSSEARALCEEGNTSGDSAHEQAGVDKGVASARLGHRDGGSSGGRDRRRCGNGGHDRNRDAGLGSDGANGLGPQGGDVGGRVGGRTRRGSCVGDRIPGRGGRGGGVGHQAGRDGAAGAVGDRRVARGDGESLGQGRGGGGGALLSDILSDNHGGAGGEKSQKT